MTVHRYPIQWESRAPIGKSGHWQLHEPSAVDARPACRITPFINIINAVEAMYPLRSKERSERIDRLH
eukprot:1956860-Rhodomonas_salina.2